MTTNETNYEAQDNNTTVTHESSEPQKAAPEPAKTEGEGANQDEQNPTLEQLKAELAAEKAARQKDKAALDKALKEKGDITKQLRMKQTVEEQEAEAKREEEEQLKERLEELEGYKRKNEAKERYLLQGMEPEMALKAAEAEVTGDMDALTDIQKQHTAALLKAQEAEWKRSRPRVSVGDGSYTSMTKEEIMAIQDRSERRKAIAQNLDSFK